MDILKTPIPQSVFDDINNYIDNKVNLTISNPSNVATGTNTATLDTMDGVINYTTSATSGVPNVYALNNQLVTPDTLIIWSVKYESTSDEEVIPLSYNCGNGFINFNIGMYNGTSSFYSIKIYFRIIN